MTDILADRLLVLLRSRPGKKQGWLAIAKKLRCPEESILVAVQQLSEWGYRIRTNRKEKTSAFIAGPDLLTATEIGYNLKTKFIGQQVHSFRKLKSSNDLAAQLAREGAAEGAIVTTEEQTAGRGRLGRSWHSPVGVGIYLSIVLRPPLGPDRAPGISLMTSLALAETISGYLPGQVQIKWPNDILICGKKAAGILTELSVEKKKIEFVIVGVGINVNQTGGMFPDEIKQTATSIRRTLRRKVKRVELLQRFLAAFEREYKLYKNHQLNKSRRRLLKFSSLIGHEISFTLGREQFTGQAVDINNNGALIVETERGRQTINAGEVSLHKKTD